MSRLTNPLAAFCFVVLFGSATLLAQTPATPNPGSAQASMAYRSQSQTYIVPAPTAAGCPVSMHALHGSGGGLVMTSRPQSAPANDADPKNAGSGVEQRIHLILGGTKNFSRVIAAKVTVYGSNGKLRFDEASSNQPWSATRTLDLKLDAAPDGAESTDMILPGFSSVQSITVNSLTFADGSTWTSFNGKACQVAPDPFMLVSAH